MSRRELFACAGCCALLAAVGATFASGWVGWLGAGLAAPALLMPLDAVIARAIA